MNSHTTDSYYCDCGIEVVPINPTTYAETEDESADHGGDEEFDGVCPVITRDQKNYTIDPTTYAETEDESVDHGGDEEFDGVCPVITRHQKNYTILKVKDIVKRQVDGVEAISDVLRVSRVDACALMCYYNWDVARVHEEWFPDEERVRKSVGILENPSTKISRLSRKFYCNICFESHKSNQRRWASCGHPFCVQCWETYISVAVNNNGLGCLRLKCPEPPCPAIVGLDMIRTLGSGSDYTKYQKYVLRSYVEGSKNRKWCPAPGCENAVECEADASESYDVNCDCGHKFCWNCTEEAHRPVDCGMVAKWNEKNLNEAGNMTWINAFTKPCPKCNQPIEKNQGCNHMTCRCDHDFCWSCLGSWLEHGGSLYSCNRYTQAMREEDMSRDMVKRDLERYTHYYERWASTDKSKKIALVDLNRARDVYVHKVARVQREPDVQLLFVTEAWEQIVECRRVLKWSYAYGYFIPEGAIGKMMFFEHLQGEAEKALERLHHCAEKEMEKYLDSDGPLQDFGDFRCKMTNLTQVTRQYFENLVRALENNLSEVSEISSQKNSSS